MFLPPVSACGRFLSADSAKSDGISRPVDLTSGHVAEKGETEKVVCLRDLSGMLW